MSFVLYNAPQSTCSQRVRFVLNAKGLSFEEHKLDLLEGDQLKPEYLAINPNGVVPSLVHNGNPIIDSAVICEYIDELVPDTVPLRPAGLLKLAEMRAKMRFVDEVPAASVRVPTYNIAFLPRFQAMSDAEFSEFAHSKPLRKEFMLAMGRSGFPKSDMEQSLDRLNRTLDRVGDWISSSGGPWAMGSRISLVDVMLMPIIVRMDDLKLGKMWDNRADIARWFDNIRSERAYKPTYYVGSLLTEQFPHLSKR